MLKECIVAAGLLAGSLAFSNASSPVHLPAAGYEGYSPRTNNCGIAACEALKNAGLVDRLLFPTDVEYEPQIATWYSLNSRLRPYCLVLPQSTSEVAAALSALITTDGGAGDWHIAVRSGGHGMPGSNNIDHGVTIDLSMMNSTTYDLRTNVAKVEPGARWKDVYADLQTKGVTVSGGRDGIVGIGGYLLGGGISFFSGKTGLGCDTVVNYEVVLANGTIVNANNTTNPDLWRALKGGGSNFGIVTRFDMEAIPTRDIYCDLRYLTLNYSEAMIKTIVEFADQDESLADNVLVSLYNFNTTISPEIIIVAIHANTEGNDDDATGFDHIKAIPAFANATGRRTMAEAGAVSQLAESTRNFAGTLTFRNDPKIIAGCVKIFEELVQVLRSSIGPDNFVAGILFQPFPSYVGQISRKRGGNMLGWDSIQGNMVVWNGGVAVSGDERLFAIAQAEFNVMAARIKELSRSLRGDLDFIYLNYAYPNQDPLGSYGAVNIRHIRDVAARYDPTGVFQTRIPGGFKISRVA